LTTGAQGSALSAAELRQQILSRFAGTAIPSDLPAAAAARVDRPVLAAWFKMPLRPAAVLLPFVERGDQLHLMLTQRTHDLPDHPGQVAFPGGSYEASDPDLEYTALREAEEEVGLKPDQIEVAGYLPAQAVISGYAVLPVVGFFRPAYTPRIDTREVASVFEVPLDFLQDEKQLVRIDRERNGIVLPTYEYEYDGHRIWGATALMIRQFIAMLMHGDDADPRSLFPLNRS